MAGKALMKTTQKKNDFGVIEKLIVGGDLSVLNNEDRMTYYGQVCNSLGLDPLSRPFEYLKLSNKLVLYPRAEATFQLRRIHNISVEIIQREMQDDLYIVIAKATTPDGRSDECIAALPIVKQEGSYKTTNEGRRFVTTGNWIKMSPEEIGNVIMKCETKAKRRVTLSMCGLGDLGSFDDIPNSDPSASIEEGSEIVEIVSDEEESTKAKAKTQSPEQDEEERKALKAELHTIDDQYKTATGKSLFDDIARWLQSKNLGSIDDLSTDKLRKTVEGAKVKLQEAISLTDVFPPSKPAISLTAEEIEARDELIAEINEALKLTPLPNARWLVDTSLSITNKRTRTFEEMTPSELQQILDAIVKLEQTPFEQS